MIISKVSRAKPQRWDSSFDPDMTEKDVERLLSVPLFKGMDQELFPRHMPLAGILRNDTRIRKFNRGELIVRQGDYGNSAYLILKGAVRVVLQPGLPRKVLGHSERGKKSLWQQLWQGFTNTQQNEVYEEYKEQEKKTNGDETRVFLQDVPRILNKHNTVSLTEGEIFGELTALSRLPRSATIFAEGDDVELLEIRWQGLRDLMKYNKEMQKYLSKIYKERALDSYFRAIPIFQDLPDERIAKLKDAAQFYTFGEYSWSGEFKKLSDEERKAHFAKEEVVVREEEYPNGIFMVRAGFARLSKAYGNGQQTITYLGPGKQYGMREIFHNYKNPNDKVNYHFTLTVLGYAHMIFLPTNQIEENLFVDLTKNHYPPSIVKLQKDGSQREKKVATLLSQEKLEFLTENHFFNGKKAMVIDMNRCTRCDDCVRACESTHDGDARFLRNGPMSGNLMVANACMHCADPVCMIGCPTGAIHHDLHAGGEVVINRDTCIGCGVCESNCPYDAIRMVNTRSKKGNFIVDQDYKSIKKATKCDLCVEQHGGPACERACPHGALRRVNLNELNPYKKDLEFLSGS